MRLTRTKSNKFNFLEKHHNINGIVSAIIGGFGAIVIIVLGFISSAKNDQGGLLIGITGLIIIVTSVIGLGMACKALKEKNTYYTFPFIGIGLNGLLLIFLALLYVMGIFM